MKIATLVPAVLLATAFSGCVVAPPVAPIYAAPSGVVYVGPTYVVPGPGYLWAYHARFGWGWHHPQYGWHRGWR